MHDGVVFELLASFFLETDVLLFVSVVPDCKLEVVLLAVLVIQIQVRHSHQISKDFLD